MDNLVIGTIRENINLLNYNLNTVQDTIATIQDTISGGDSTTTNASGGTTYTAGTGLNLVGTEFRNTAPDQVVSLTGEGSTTVTGTYPNFTILSTDTAYTNGTGVTINGNQISIGQSVANSDSPNFTQLSLGASGTNQGILNLNDEITTGTYGTVAEIKGIKAGTTSGGKLEISTKVDSGALTKQMTIDENGKFYMHNLPNSTNQNKLLYNAGTGEITYQPDTPPSGGGGSYIKRNSETYSNANSVIDGNWDTVLDTDHITNGDDGTFTINTAGNYLINFCVRFEHNGSGIIYDSYGYLERVRNGTSSTRAMTMFLDQAAGGGDYFRYYSMTGNYLEHYEEGDIIRLRISSNPSVTVSGKNASTGASRTWINFVKVLDSASSSGGGTTYTAGTGLNLVGTTFNNTAPDQIVTLTQGGSTTITGTYPNFTISSTGGVTYTQGTGVTISTSNVISIGQSVASSDSPNFTQLSLGASGTNQGILNLKDEITTGTYGTVAEIKGIKAGTNGGKLQINTKVDGGSLTERMTIDENGKFYIHNITSGTNQHKLLYNSTTGEITYQGVEPSRPYANFVNLKGGGNITLGTTATDLPFDQVVLSSGINLLTSGSAAGVRDFFTVDNSGVYVCNLSFRGGASDSWTTMELKDSNNNLIASSAAIGTVASMDAGFFVMAQLNPGTSYKFTILRATSAMSLIDFMPDGYQINCIIHLV